MHRTGLWPPVATPFGSDGRVDTAALLSHARNLIADGASGLAPLGTTSEANSMTMQERRAVLDALLNGGIDAANLLPGTGACATDDAIALSRHATTMGCAGVLLLPPFFYKGVSDDGLFNYVAQVIDGVDDPALRIYLYHIPQMAGVGWSLDLIDRLRRSFPEIVVGLKDSSGDWSNTRAVIESFDGFGVFPANEAHLSMAIPLGAAGCISATANINAGGIAALIRALHAGHDATTLQQEATRLRLAVTAGPLIPGIKATLALQYDTPDWARVRPPLVAMQPDAAQALYATLSQKAVSP